MVSLKVVWVVLDDHKTNVSEHRPGDYPLSMSELDQENSASNYLRPNSYATGHCGDRARVVSHWFAKYAPVLLRQVDGIAIDRGEPLAERLATVGVMTGFSAPIGKITRVPLRDVWKHEALDFTRLARRELTKRPGPCAGSEGQVSCGDLSADATSSMVKPICEHRC